MHSNAQKEGPLRTCQRELSAGRLQDDSAQLRVVGELDQLWHKLREIKTKKEHYQRQNTRKSFFTSVAQKFLRSSLPPKNVVPNEQGLYIVGHVGRGKTMLMDLFFSTLPPGVGKREHFVDFMRRVHQTVHTLRQVHNSSLASPVERVADQLMSRATVFCLDEFQVGDIADAMILGHLLRALFKRGAIIVTTSNTVIGDLFQGRPGADSFKPFIKIMQSYLKEVTLDSPHDYRCRHQSLDEMWLLKSQPKSQETFEKLFQSYAKGHTIKPQKISFAGHSFEVEKAAGGACMLSFAELCDRALGANDYSELARLFPVIFLDDVPQLGPHEAHIARRFILLIDILYDNQNLLFVRGDVEPEDVFMQGEGVGLYTRTFSRLTEMGSEAWVRRCEERVRKEP